MKEIVVVGGGGHGRELIDVLRELADHRPGWRVVGVVDDALDHPERLARLDVVHLGPIDWLIENPCDYAVGIGTSSVRRRVTQRLARSSSESAGPIVHPRASVGSDCRLAEGVVVYDRTVVTTNVTLGRHTHINVGCSVQHDSILGDFVQVSPGVLINGDCEIGDDVFLGSGAIVTRGSRIGAGARVGAGAVVLADVPSGCTVAGVPATVRTAQHHRD